MVKKAKTGLRIVLAKAADGAPGTNPGTIIRANPLRAGSWFIKWDSTGPADSIEDPTPYLSAKLKLYTAQAPPDATNESASEDDLDEDPPETEDSHETRKQNFAKLKKSLRGRTHAVTIPRIFVKRSYLTRASRRSLLRGSWVKSISQ